MKNIRRIIREELEKVFNSKPEVCLPNSFGFAIFGESGENPVKKMNQLMSEGHTTRDSNYEFGPFEIWPKIGELKSIGKKLDSNYSYNIANLQVLSTGERSGRALAEIGYPDGTVVLFYKSSKGTSGKEKGGWFPIPGFLDSDALGIGLKKGWFFKTDGVDDRYGFKTFQGTADYLKANESRLEEIDLSINSSAKSRPGIDRQFPKKEEGGDSLNISVSDGPHEFPNEEDLK